MPLISLLNKKLSHINYNYFLLLNDCNTLPSIKLINDVKTLREVFAYFFNFEHIFDNMRYLKEEN